MNLALLDFGTWVTWITFIFMGLLILFRMLDALASSADNRAWWKNK